MYADDTQLMRSTGINRLLFTIERLQACIDDIRSWCRSRRLRLNPAKTELIWFGSRTNLRKMYTENLALQVDEDTIHPVNTVRGSHAGQ